LQLINKYVIPKSLVEHPETSGIKMANLVNLLSKFLVTFYLNLFKELMPAGLFTNSIQAKFIKYLNNLFVFNCKPNEVALNINRLRMIIEYLRFTRVFVSSPNDNENKAQLFNKILAQFQNIV
jgi:hypothetical protein